MAANMKKAGAVIRRSFRSKRYGILDAKENNYIDSPVKATSVDRVLNRGHKESSSSGDENELDKWNQTVLEATLPKKQGLRRGTSVTQSMRDAVGTLRQKLRMSVRRSHAQITPTRAGKRRTMSSVKMSSPFKIDTPTRCTRSNVKTCLSLETPTRLRREVETLTANMQALSALTPNTLHARSRARKTPPLTNGSLKTPKASRRRITTEIY